MEDVRKELGAGYMQCSTEDDIMVNIIAGSSR